MVRKGSPGEGLPEGLGGFEAVAARERHPPSGDLAGVELGERRWSSPAFVDIV